MPNTREKLIDLIETTVPREKVAAYGEVPVTVGRIADHLIANGVTVQQWIPVTERLPESKEKLLVYGGNIEIWFNGVKQPMPSIFTGYMRGLDEGWFTWDTDDYISDVTHWMPLPQPPDEEGE